MTLSLLCPSETGKNIPMFQSDADMLAILFPNISTTSVSRFQVNFNLSGASLEKNRVINPGLIQLQV